MVTNTGPLAPYGARVAISGTLTVDGIISASHLHIENISEIDATGSTYFGNTRDDLHARTGSLSVFMKGDSEGVLTTILRATASANGAVPMVGIGIAPGSFSGSGLVVAGNVSASQGITASAFFGDGQYLTNAGDPKQWTSATDGSAYIYATASSMVGATTIPQNSAVFEVGGTGLANIPTVTASNYVSASAVYGGRLMVGSQIGNTANHTTVAGGQFNEASANYAVVLGGFRNRATATYTVVCGGLQNTASAVYTAIGGGSTNKAMAQYSTVAGGYKNHAEQGSAIVAGGDDNKAGATWSTIGGGQYNTVVGTLFQVATHGIVGGGFSNTASAQYCTIGGGHTNKINWGAHYSGLLGGHGNTVTGQYSSVVGGRWNKAGANYTAVIGGSGSEATGQGSIAIGSNISSSAVDHITLGGGSASPNYVIECSGTLRANGDITASVGVKASFFEGDGSRLSDVTVTPGGSNTQVQYNNGGTALGGDASLVIDTTSSVLTISGSDGNGYPEGTLALANTDAQLFREYDTDFDEDWLYLAHSGQGGAVAISASMGIALMGATASGGEVGVFVGNSNFGVENASEEISFHVSASSGAIYTAGDIAATDIAAVNISGSGEISGSSFTLYKEALGALTNALDITAPSTRGTYLQVRNTYDRIRLTGSAIEVTGALHNDQGITIGSDSFKTMLGVSGSVAAAVRRVTGNWSVDNGTGGSGYDDYIIGVSASGPVQITLPEAAQYKGRTIIIKDEYGDGGTARLAQNAITASVKGGSGNYLEREPLTTYYLYGSSQGSFTLYSDGINVWYVI